MKRWPTGSMKELHAELSKLAREAEARYVAADEALDTKQGRVTREESIAVEALEIAARAVRTVAQSFGQSPRRRKSGT